MPLLLLLFVGVVGGWLIAVVEEGSGAGNGGGWGSWGTTFKEVGSGFGEEA